MDQVLPSQCSTNVLPVPSSGAKDTPTAHASSGARSATSSRVSRYPGAGGGVGTVFQVAPFQCSASVAFPSLPTAQASESDSAFTRNRKPPFLGSGGTILHEQPASAAATADGNASKPRQRIETTRAVFRAMTLFPPEAPTPGPRRLRGSPLTIPRRAS